MAKKLSKPRVQTEFLPGQLDMVDWMGGLRWLKKRSAVDDHETADDINRHAYFGPIRATRYQPPLLRTPRLPAIVQMRVLATAIWGSTWHGRAASELGVDQKQLRRWEETDPNTMQFRGTPPSNHIERLRQVAERYREGIQMALSLSESPLNTSPEARPIRRRGVTPFRRRGASNADGAV
ncbi:hypothetical protein [Methylobacterium fujisawaense]|uniref:hypothetical protein n=1 Tax=Methylobacterium fujisawaense TaxID=107400 RepID=UPI002F35113D